MRRLKSMSFVASQLDSRVVPTFRPVKENECRNATNPHVVFSLCACHVAGMS